MAAALLVALAGCSGGPTGAAVSDTTPSTVAGSPSTTALVTTTVPLPDLASSASPDFAAACRDERPTALVVGDSVLQGAQSELHAPLRERFDVTYDALRDRPTATGSRIVDRTAADDRQVLIVGLGLNDGPGVFEDDAYELLDNASGSELILWMTLPDARSHYPEVNEVLEDMSRDHPELELVEWGERADDDGEMTGGDGIHLTGEGDAALTELILSHLDDWLAVVPVCGDGN